MRHKRNYYGASRYTITWILWVKRLQLRVLTALRLCLLGFEQVNPAVYRCMQSTRSLLGSQEF